MTKLSEFALLSALALIAAATHDVSAQRIQLEPKLRGALFRLDEVEESGKPHKTPFNFDFESFARVGSRVVHSKSSVLMDPNVRLPHQTIRTAAFAPVNFVSADHNHLAPPLIAHHPPPRRSLDARPLSSPLPLPNISPALVNCLENHHGFISEP